MNLVDENLDYNLRIIILNEFSTNHKSFKHNALSPMFTNLVSNTF